MEVGSLHYDLNIDDKKLRGQLDKADHHVKGFGDKLGQHWDKSLQASQRFMAGITAVTAATVAFGVKSYNAFLDSQRVMAQTEAVLKSTGSVAGVTTEQITKLAKSLQLSSKFTDEQIQSGQNLLLTFTKIGKDIFPDATQAIVDMSAALGQDMKASAIQLGKALNDPIRGVMALRKVGVSFTEQQQDQIKALVESGKLLEAQKLILAELKVEFGGSAKAASDAAGPMEKLKDVFNESQEIIGSLISKAITPFIDKWAEWASRIDEEKIQAFVNNVLGWLRVHGDTLAGIIGGALAPAVVSMAAAFALLFLRLAPFMALGALITNFNEILAKFNSLNPLVQAAIVFFGSLAGLLGGIFVLNLVKAGVAMGALTGNIAKVPGAYRALAAVIGSPLVMPAIAVAAALAALALVMRAANDTKRAVEGAVRASEIHDRAQSDALQQLRNLRDTGTPAQRARALKALKAAGSFASGVTNFAGGLAYVHQGELLVNMPKGTDVIPKKEVEQMGSNTTINIGTIQDRVDAEWLLRRLDRNYQLESMGLSP